MADVHNYGMLNYYKNTARYVGVKCSDYLSVITGQVMKISRVWVMYWRRKADCKNLTMKMLIIKADDAKYNCWTIDDYANYIFCLSWSDPFLLFFELTKAKVCCKWVSVHLNAFIGCLRCENICCNSTIQENSLPPVHTWLGFLWHSSRTLCAILIADCSSMFWQVMVPTTTV